MSLNILICTLYFVYWRIAPLHTRVNSSISGTSTYNIHHHFLTFACLNGFGVFSKPFPVSSMMLFIPSLAPFLAYSHNLTIFSLTSLPLPLFSQLYSITALKYPSLKYHTSHILLQSLFFINKYD